MKRSKARRDAVSLFLQAPPCSWASTVGGAIGPVNGSAGPVEFIEPIGSIEAIGLEEEGPPPRRSLRACPGMLEWFMAMSRFAMRMSVRNPRTTSTHQAASFPPGRALPLSDAGPGDPYRPYEGPPPVAGPGA